VPRRDTFLLLVLLLEAQKPDNNFYSTNAKVTKFTFKAMHEGRVNSLLAHENVRALIEDVYKICYR